jgi:hypothetical protein
VYWGTNQEGGPLYTGRVHVVWPAGPRQGMCGLPVEAVWPQRPPTPTRLCPECCVAAMARLFPAFPVTDDDSP